MEKYYPYPCERCGSCCLDVNLIEELKIFDRGDGVCKNLTEKNLCKIYSNRPSICDGKHLYENFFSDMTVAEFHGVMKELCSKVRGREIEGLHKKISDA